MNGEKNYRKYKDFEEKHSRTILGQTMLKFTALHNKGIPIYEITITIKPSCKIKTYGKLYYADPDTQYRAIKQWLLTQCNKREFEIIAIPEFHSNGNIHIHAAIYHHVGYEIHLRRFQTQCRRVIGNSKMSKIKYIQKYFGYILKDYESTGLEAILTKKEYQTPQHTLKSVTLQELQEYHQKLALGRLLKSQPFRETIKQLQKEETSDVRML